MGQACSACSLKEDELQTEQRAFDPPSNSASTLLSSKEPVFPEGLAHQREYPKSCYNEELARIGLPRPGSHLAASRQFNVAAGATAENSAKALVAPTLLDTTEPVLSIAAAKEIKPAAVSHSTDTSRNPTSKALAAAHAAKAELERKVTLPAVSTEDSKQLPEPTNNPGPEALERAVLNALGVEARALLNDYFAEEGAGQALVCAETALGDSIDLVVHGTSKVAALGFSHDAARTTENEVQHMSIKLSEELETEKVPCEIRAVEAPKTIWTHFPSVGTWVQRLPVQLKNVDPILATSSTEKAWDETCSIDGTPSSCMRPTCQVTGNFSDETLLIDGAPFTQLSCQEVTCGETHYVEQIPNEHAVVLLSRWKRLPSVGTWLINSLDPAEDSACFAL